MQKFKNGPESILSIRVSIRVLQIDPIGNRVNPIKVLASLISQKQYYIQQFNTLILYSYPCHHIQDMTLRGTNTCQ